MFASAQVTTVMDIGVLEGHRRQGIGRRLLDEVVALARDAGSDELNAHVWSGNKSSEALFTKAGFTPEMQFMNLRLGSTADVDVSKDDWSSP